MTGNVEEGVKERGIERGIETGIGIGTGRGTETVTASGKRRTMIMRGIEEGRGKVGIGRGERRIGHVVQGAEVGVETAGTASAEIIARDMPAAAPVLEGAVERGQRMETREKSLRRRKKERRRRTTERTIRILKLLKLIGYVHPLV